MREFVKVIASLFIALFTPNCHAAESGATPKAVATYTIAALGDSLGDGLWEGLYRSLLKDKRSSVQRIAKRSVGFARSTLIAQIDAAVAKGPVHAFTMVIGVNDDDNSFFINGRPVALFGSDEWKRLYSERVGAFMDRLGQTGSPVIWLLLPAMRQPSADRAAQLVNEIYLQAAQSRPFIHVVVTRKATGDERGEYTAYLKDAAGHARLLRHPDGVHFQDAGYLLLAGMVLDRLKEVSPEFRAASGVATSPQSGP